MQKVDKMVLFNSVSPKRIQGFMMFLINSNMFDFGSEQTDYNNNWVHACVGKLDICMINGMHHACVYIIHHTSVIGLYIIYNANVAFCTTDI